jgi:hypothetical protein
MEHLEKAIPQLQKDENWVGKLFEKRFHHELDDEYKETFTLEERREQLIRMYEASQNRSQSLKSSLLLEILENGVKLDLYDKKYFIEYLKNPLRWSCLKSDNNQPDLGGYNWNQYIGNIQVRSVNNYDYNGQDQKLYKTYLEQFYKDKGDLKEFEEYFEQHFIKDLIEEFDFYSGKSVATTSLNTSKFEDLKDKVLIELLNCNKELFKREDRVQIVAELKNTPTLYVKIYEFDRKTEFSGCSKEYYEKNLVPFRTDINLEGLKTENEAEHNFDQSAQTKFRHVFEFPELDDKVGLFIIEFISNGHSSRAVIKKGSLSLVTQATVAGHVAYVLDENKEICKGDDAGMWFDNKFYKADPAKGGKIIIPYEKNASAGKAILVNNGFAQLAEFNRMTENYTLDVGYFVLNESLLMGNEAQIVVRPVLKVNQRSCTLKAIKSTIIKVTTTSFIDNLPTTKIFEDLKLTDNNEIILNFQIPPNLQAINVEFEAKVRNISHQKFETLTSRHDLYLKNHCSDYIYYEDYLRKIDGEYYYYVLGKNGEPIPDLSVNISLTHALYPTGSSSGTSVTDEEGKICIGKCKDVIKISANFEGSQGYSNCEWTLPQKKETCAYPHSINVLEDESIEIPFPSEELSNRSLLLLKHNSQGKIIENRLKNAKVETDEEFGSRNLVISDLEFGHYTLELKETGTVIEIAVHQGVYWETDNFILKHDSIVEKRDKSNFIRISNPQIGNKPKEESKTKGNPDEENEPNKLKFKIKGYKNNPRVHMFGVNFMPNSGLKDFKEVERLMAGNIALDVFKFASWKNAYLPTRELGDEYRYVFERKFLERFIGNTLDRPQLVLKRNKIRETQFDQESLTNGQLYQNRDVETFADFESRNCIPMAANFAPMMKQQVAFGGFSQPFGANSCLGLRSNTTYLAQTQYKSFMNFLQNPAFIGSNLHPDAEGNIEVEFEADKYSTILILAMDDQTFTQSIVDIQDTKRELEKRDLALTDPLDENKFYKEVRNSDNYRKDEKFKIEDITSTDYIIVDSLEKVKSVQDEIRKVNCIGPAGKDLQFLLKWHTFSEEEKNKKYNRFICHEVNLFIYFKDTPYFFKVVKPFLANKMEKTFVDHFLLGNSEEVLEYAKIHKLKTLNSFEQCLLIEAVFQKDQKMATKLAERVMIEAESKKVDIQTKNKMFDTVLNLNMLQKDKVKLEDLAQESDSEPSHSNDPPSDPFGGSSFAPPPSASYMGGAPTSALFGGPPQNYSAQSSGFGFGGNQQPQQNFGGGGLFGSANNNNAGGLFGASNSNTGYIDNFGGGFGGNAMPQQQNNLFGVQSQFSQAENNFNQMQAQQPAFDFNNNQNFYQENIGQQQDLFGGGFGEFGELQERRQQRSQFQALEDACEYSEMNYYSNNDVRTTHIFQCNQLWADLAEYAAKTGTLMGFQSSSFMYCYNKTSEMVCSWAVLDLEPASKNHVIKATGGKGISVKPASNIVLFKKEIQETEAEIDNNLLVIHRFFELNNKGSQEKLKEFLTHQVYGCEVIITNVSTSAQDFQVLWQIPEGSLPVFNTNYQKSQNMALSGYSTTTFDFYFYFPDEGTFTQFPSNVKVGEKVVAVANKCQFKVCSEHQEDSFETFRDILISGDKKIIYEFLQTANLLNGEKGFKFDDMYWMLKDKQFFTEVVQILRERHIYDSNVWGYSFKHYDIEAIKEHIMSQEFIINRLGTFFESSLVSVSPENTRFRHLDYFPLINARVHSVGKNINAGLLNVQFRQTYYQFLKAMIEKDELSTSDWLQLSYYFLLQDRIKETIQIITGSSQGAKVEPKIDPDSIKHDSGLKLQYDYMVAYLDFFNGIDSNFKTARKIAKNYENYPVISWRVLFTEILDQLSEYDGIEEAEYEIDQEDEEKKKQNLKKSKKLEPYLECEIQGKQIKVEFANIKKIKIKYYVIDLEVLFSRAPFLIKNTEDLANAKPIRMQEFELEENLKSSMFDILEEFHSQNVMIEVHGESKQQFLTYFSNSMKVTILEDFGEIKVTDKDDQKLQKVYIKAIAQHSDGTTKFFKDGYTDIRGKFEYAQLSSKKMSGIEKIRNFGHE